MFGKTHRLEPRVDVGLLVDLNRAILLLDGGSSVLELISLPIRDREDLREALLQLRHLSSRSGDEKVIDVRNHSTTQVPFSMLISKKKKARIELVVLKLQDLVADDNLQAE